MQGKSTMHLPALLTQDIMLQNHNRVLMLGHCAGGGGESDSTVPFTDVSTRLGCDCVGPQDSVKFSIPTLYLHHLF